MMNRAFFSRLLVLFFGAASTLVACSEDLDGGSRRVVFVRQALAPPVDHASSACVYSSDANAAALFSGVFDLGVADTYTLTLLVQSTDAGVSTSISGAHVALRDPDGTLIRELDQVTAGFIEPGGFGVVSFVAVDAAAHDLLLVGLQSRSSSKTVTIEVGLTGSDPATGSDASAPIYKFPLKACNGCLVSFETGNDPILPVQPNCSAPRRTGGPATPCFLGQDEVVPCQLCVGRPSCDPQVP